MGADIPLEDRHHSVAKLIDKHSKHIRHLIRRRSGSAVLKRASVDDIYQETVARAIGSAQSFQFSDDRSFLAWIGTIVRRVIARSLSGPARDTPTVRIRRAASSGTGVSETDLSSGGRTPSSCAAAQERQKDLRKAMERLPDHYRRVLVLYKLEERSLSEVAARMGRTKGATCRLMARALGELRQHLAEQ